MVFDTGRQTLWNHLLEEAENRKVASPAAGSSSNLRLPSTGTGTETPIYTFTSKEYPQSNLMIDSAGNLYGLTAKSVIDVNKWDEFCMAHNATTINENGLLYWRVFLNVRKDSGPIYPRWEALSGPRISSAAPNDLLYRR
jgi:hypothetical protein